MQKIWDPLEAATPYGRRSSVAGVSNKAPESASETTRSKTALQVLMTGVIARAALSAIKRSRPH